jgi:hypothetical protein
MMRKLSCQVMIVAFTSLSFISASLAENTKLQRSTKAHTTKASLGRFSGQNESAAFYEGAGYKSASPSHSSRSE